MAQISPGRAMQRDSFNKLLENVMGMLQRKKLMDFEQENRMTTIGEQQKGYTDLENLRTTNDRGNLTYGSQLRREEEDEKLNRSLVETHQKLLGDIAKNPRADYLQQTINLKESMGKDASKEQAELSGIIRNHVSAMVKISGGGTLTPEDAQGIIAYSDVVKSQFMSQAGQNARTAVELPNKKFEADTGRMNALKPGAEKTGPWSKQIKEELASLKELLAAGEITQEEYAKARQDRLGIYKAPAAERPVDPDLKYTMDRVFGGEAAPGGKTPPPVAELDEYGVAGQTTGPRPGYVGEYLYLGRDASGKPSWKRVK